MGDLLTVSNLAIFTIAAATTVVPAVVFYLIGHARGSSYWREMADLADERATDIAKRADYYLAELDQQRQKFGMLERQFNYLAEQSLRAAGLQNIPPLVMKNPELPPLGPLPQTTLSPEYLQNAVNQQAQRYTQEELKNDKA